jgi:acyl-coenzyme A thioesterase PaaI-like protein
MANFHPMGHLMLERKQRRSSPLREEAGQVTLELEATKRLTAQGRFFHGHFAQDHGSGYIFLVLI